MQNIEVLTEAEREDLECGVSGGEYWLCAKALRIIDAQAAALAELRAECERLRAESTHNAKAADYWAGQYTDCEQMRLKAGIAAAAAESKLAAADVECERLCARIMAERAAAEALLRRYIAPAGANGIGDDSLYADTCAHLTSPQPAAPARTEAEQRVLDAASQLPVDGSPHALRALAYLPRPAFRSSPLQPFAAAELARRGLK